MLPQEKEPAAPRRRPLAEPLAEAQALLEAAAEANVVLRLTGGVAVGLRCPSSRRPPLERPYKDIDLVGSGEERQGVDALLHEFGYAADREFNLLQGHGRLLYWDRANGRQLDVFLDRIAMCHTLELQDRLLLDERTLPPADLLLSKLQVVETNERDLKDATALLLDDTIDDARIASVLATDWGWWKTVTQSLDKVESYAASLPGFDAFSGLVVERLRVLRRLIEGEPKSLRWKARARIGERVRWYELPEEDH